MWHCFSLFVHEMIVVADSMLVQYPDLLAQIRRDQAEELEKKRTKDSGSFAPPAHDASARAVEVN